MPEVAQVVTGASFIPEDQELWKTENFQGFLEERRRLLAVAMTKLLKRL